MRAGASDPEITETQFIHGLRVEQVAPVEDNRRMHALSDLQKIDAAKLIPFGGQDECLCILDCFQCGVGQDRTFAQIQFCDFAAPFGS